MALLAETDPESLIQYCDQVVEHIQQCTNRALVSFAVEKLADKVRNISEGSIKGVTPRWMTSLICSHYPCETIPILFELSSNITPLAVLDASTLCSIRSLCIASIHQFPQESIELLRSTIPAAGLEKLLAQVVFSIGSALRFPNAPGPQDDALEVVFNALKYERGMKIKVLTQLIPLVSLTVSQHSWFVDSLISQSMQSSYIPEHDLENAFSILKCIIEESRLPPTSTELFKMLHNLLCTKMDNSFVTLRLSIYDVVKSMLKCHLTSEHVYWMAPIIDRASLELIHFTSSLKLSQSQTPPEPQVRRRKKKQKHIQTSSNTIDICSLLPGVKHAIALLNAAFTTLKDTIPQETQGPVIIRIFSTVQYLLNHLEASHYTLVTGLVRCIYSFILFLDFGTSPNVVGFTALVFQKALSIPNASCQSICRQGIALCALKNHPVNSAFEVPHYLMLKSLSNYIQSEEPQIVVQKIENSSTLQKIDEEDKIEQHHETIDSDLQKPSVSEHIPLVILESSKTQTVYSSEDFLVSQKKRKRTPIFMDLDEAFIFADKSDDDEEPLWIF